MMICKSPVETTISRVFCKLWLTSGEFHLWLPTENENERIPEFLRPNDGMLDITNGQQVRSGNKVALTQGDQ
jgi:hypothetical protein